MNFQSGQMIVEQHSRCISRIINSRDSIEVIHIRIGTRIRIRIRARVGEVTIIIRATRIMAGGTTGIVCPHFK